MSAASAPRSTQYDIKCGCENIGYDISGYIDCASDVQKYLKNALSVSIFAGTDVNFQNVGVVRGTFFSKISRQRNWSKRRWFSVLRPALCCWNAHKSAPEWRFLARKACFRCAYPITNKYCPISISRESRYCPISISLWQVIVLPNMGISHISYNPYARPSVASIIYRDDF